MHTSFWWLVARHAAGSTRKVHEGTYSEPAAAGARHVRCVLGRINNKCVSVVWMFGHIAWNLLIEVRENEEEPVPLGQV